MHTPLTQQSQSGLTYVVQASEEKATITTPTIFEETNCVCDRFYFPCHLDSHIPSSSVDLTCVVFLFVQTMVWLPVLVFVVVVVFRGGGGYNFLMCPQKLIHAGSMQTLKESLLWKLTFFPQQGVEPATPVCRTRHSTKWTTSLPLYVFLKRPMFFNIPNHNSNNVYVILSVTNSTNICYRITFISSVLIIICLLYNVFSSFIYFQLFLLFLRDAMMEKLFITKC